MVDCEGGLEARVGKILVEEREIAGSKHALVHDGLRGQ